MRERGDEFAAKVNEGGVALVGLNHSSLREWNAVCKHRVITSMSQERTSRVLMVMSNTTKPPEL